MTILNYTETIKNEYAILYFTGRDYSIDRVVLTNQESKKEYDVGFEPFPSSVQFGLREAMSEDDANNDSTFSIKLIDSKGRLIYTDIVVFEGRINTQLDYTEDEESNTGYVFG